MKLVLVSAVVMCLSHTVAKERIFAPVRRFLGGNETFLGYLVSCPYCVSHYFAFGLVWLTGLRPVDVVVGPSWLQAVLEWFCASILVVSIAAFLRVVFWLVDEGQGLVRRRQRMAEEDT